MEELLYGSVFLQDADFTQEKVDEIAARAHDGHAVADEGDEDEYGRRLAAAVL